MVDRHGRPILVVAILLAVLGAAWQFGGFLTAERVVVTGTPSPFALPGGATQDVPVPAGAAACTERVGIDPGDEVAEFEVKGRRPARLAVELRGAGYRDRAEVRTRGGRVYAPFAPPPREVVATVCVRNLERRAIALVGAGDGRLQSGTTTSVAGRPAGRDFSLHLLARERSSLLARASDVVAAMAIWPPDPVGEAVVWLVLVGLLTGVLVGVPLVYAASLRGRDDG